MFYFVFEISILVLDLSILILTYLFFVKLVYNLILEYFPTH